MSQESTIDQSADQVATQTTTEAAAPAEPALIADQDESEQRTED